MNRVFYYEAKKDVIDHSRKMISLGYTCFADDVIGDTAINAFAGLDSEVTEEAISFINSRIRNATLIESQIIYSQLITHYPRIRRIANVINKQGSAIYIHKSRMSIYDLAIASIGICDFSSLTGDREINIDLKSLVFFHKVKMKWFFKKLLSALFKKKKQVVIHNVCRQHVLFIAHDNEVNLYSRPIPEILKSLTEKNIAFTILACDQRAKSYYEKMGINTVSPDGLPSNGNRTPSAFEQAWQDFWHHKNDHCTGDSLYDHMLQMSCNASLYSDIYNTAVLVSKIEAYMQKEHVTDLFYAPDCTPIVHALKHSKEIATCSSNTIICAGISDNERSIDSYAANTIFCSGTLARDILVKRLPDKEIVMVGNTSIHHLHKCTKNQQTLKRCVLVATSGYDERELDWIQYLVDTIPKEHYTVIIKPHPSFSTRYQKLSITDDTHTIAKVDERIEDLVEWANIVITDHSQVGIDAHLIGKPVISMCLKPKEILYMRDIKTIAYVDREQDLLEAVLAAPDGITPDKAFCDQYDYCNDGRYAIRTVSHIITQRGA